MQVNIPWPNSSNHHSLTTFRSHKEDNYSATESVPNEKPTKEDHSPTNAEPQMYAVAVTLAANPWCDWMVKARTTDRITEHVGGPLWEDCDWKVVV